MLAFFCVGLATAASAFAGQTAFSAQGSFSGSSDTFLGYAVAVSGNTAVVGAINDNANKGAAYVYVWSGTAWSAQQTLTASDGSAGDEFGYAVAVSGNTALVAASDKGYVYAFTRSGTTWSQQQEITEAAPGNASGDCFGCSIALAGSTAIIGAPGALNGVGQAYAYVNSGSGWASQAQFAGQGAGAALGFSVALSSDASTAVLGAFGANNGTGEAYVLATNGSTWSQQAVLTSADGQANDRFGYSVAVTSGTVLVGAYGNASNRGAAYVFTSQSGSWMQQAKLVAADGAAGDEFGYSVALSDGTAVVGAYEAAGPEGPGAAYVLTGAGASWQQQKLMAPSSQQYFGYAVAATSTTAVVGAFGASNDAGAVYMYGATTTTAAPALGSPIAFLALCLLLAQAGFRLAPRTRGTLS